jgi:predicted TIM-barrel fold metal-dependent hydrolase
MIIDSHSHIYPRKYLDLLAVRETIPRLERAGAHEKVVFFKDEEQIAGPPRFINKSFYSVDEKLSYMDQYGIDVSVIGLGNPWLDFLEEEESLHWGQILNEEIDAICTQSNRLWGIGTIGLLSVSKACEQLGLLKILPNIKGVAISTRPGGRHLDDPELKPFWAIAEKEQIPVIIHPHYTIGIEWMGGYGHAMIISLGFTFETATAATRLILGGIFDEFPNLSIVLSHGGGALPYLRGRLDKYTAVDVEAKRKIKHDFEHYLRKFWYDAILYNIPSLKCLLDTADSKRIVFGTDHPFDQSDPNSNIEIVNAAVSNREKSESILAANAMQLFKLS